MNIDTPIGEKQSREQTSFDSFECSSECEIDGVKRSRVGCSFRMVGAANAKTATTLWNDVMKNDGVGGRVYTPNQCN